jgi:hypothetical protein
MKSETLAALVMVGWVLFGFAGLTIYPVGIVVTAVAVAVAVCIGTGWSSRLRSGLTFVLAVIPAVFFTLLAVATIKDGRTEFIALSLGWATLTDALAVGCGLLLWRSVRRRPRM